MGTDGTIVPGPTAAPESASARQAIQYFATAFVFLLAGLGLIAAQSSQLASGGFASPGVIGALHLITLGWLSLSIIGALQVFIGVALGAVPFGKRLASWIRWVWALGTLTFAAGFGLGIPPAIALGACLIGAGLLLFTIQIVPPLVDATRGNLTRAYSAVALVSLWGVWLLGLLAAHARAGMPLVPLPPGYLGAHILLAVFGWVGAMIAGVGSHLVPMFALSRTTSQLPVRLALPFWGALPVLGALSAFDPATWTRAAWSSAAVGSLLWCLQLVLFFRNRLRKEKDPGLLLAGLSTLFLPVAWVVLVSGRPVLSVALLVLGWLTLFTLGIYHRVIPFLIWFGRFARRMGQPGLPRVNELLDARLAGATALLAPVGVAIWGVGLETGSSPALLAGALTALFAATLAAAQIRALARPFEPAHSGEKKMEITEERILRQLKSVIDPEVGLNIVDLGLVYQTGSENGVVRVEMTLTTPGCPMSSYITGEARAALLSLEDVKDVRIELVWSPPWSPDKIRPGAMEEMQRENEMRMGAR